MSTIFWAGYLSCSTTEPRRDYSTGRSRRSLQLTLPTISSLTLMLHYMRWTHIFAEEFVGSLFPMPWDHTGTMAQSAIDAAGMTTVTYPAREQYRRDRENELLRWAIVQRSRWPLPTIPFVQDARMAAQQTIFTLAGDAEALINDLFDKDKWPPPVERMPGGFIAGSDSTMWPLNWPGQLLTKVRLRSEWRREALKALEKMGLTGASLFPGLDGLGRATSLHLESGHLALRDVLTGLSPR